MKLIIDLILSGLIFFNASSIEPKKIYFDNNCSIVSDSSKASYVVQCTYVDNKLSPTHLTRLFDYPSFILISEGYYSQIHPYKIAATGIRKTYYMNGVLKGISNWTDDKPNGPYKNFFANGKVQEEANVTNGIFNGKYSIYYDNGQIEETGYDENNYRVGSYKKWDKNGNYLGEFFWETNTPSINDPYWWQNQGICRH
jgi:hypothetical protein